MRAFAPQAAPGARKAPLAARWRVSQPADRAEQEAERAAQGHPGSAPSPASRCACGGGCPRCSAPAAPTPAPADLPAVVRDAVSHDGQPLDAPTRIGMEARFGRDLGAVRVHAGAAAATSARALSAQAYALGRDIVFGAGEYAPRSAAGAHLLAHEIAHVVQPQDPAAPTIHRKGVTVGGFFANLFQSWDYSHETLVQYLGTLDSGMDIVGDDDSDDMARQIAAEWKLDPGTYDLKPSLRVLLIREMLDGAVLGSDQEGIMTLLEGSTNAELTAMFGSAPEQITLAEIRPNFGVMLDRLDRFDAQVLQKLGSWEAPAEGQSLRETLAGAEQEYGIRPDSISFSFRIGPMRLLESFLADVAIPAGGITVRITLSLEGLRIELIPGLVIDLIGPVNPRLDGLKIGFAGLKTQLELDQLSDTANAEIGALVRDMLAGTRFAAPGYDPTRDPLLLGDIRDPAHSGDIDRIRYNLQKESDEPAAPAQDKKDGAGLEEQALNAISGAGVVVEATHTKGMHNEGTGLGVEVPPGTRFSISLETEGSAAGILAKDVKLKQLHLRGSGVYIVEGQKRLVALYGIAVKPNLSFELDEFIELIPIPELLRKQWPDAGGALASGLETVDFARDAASTLSGDLGPLLGFLGLDDRPPTNTAHGVAKWLAEGLLGLLAPWLLAPFMGTIRDTLGVTQEQIDNFLGTRSG